MATQAELDALTTSTALLLDQVDTMCQRTPTSQVIAGLQSQVAQLAADKQALADHLTKLGVDADAVSAAAAKLQADK